jgi:adenosylcobinamide-GDP ribazoletransferase
MPAFGRWAMVTVARTSPYARADGGLAAPFLTHLTWGHAALATAVLSIVLSLAFGLWEALVILMAGGAVVIAVWRGCRTWFGGITGDTLGATNEVAELLFLLLVPVLVLLS